MKEISAALQNPPSLSLHTGLRFFYIYRSTYAVTYRNLSGKKKVFRDSTHVQ